MDNAHNQEMAPRRLKAIWIVLAGIALLPMLIFAFLGIRSCSGYFVPSVEATIHRTDGVHDYDHSQQVDIAALMPFMRRASWTDAWQLWKTSSDIVLMDGRKIRFEMLNPMFRIEGVDGTFLIAPTDIAAYEEVRDRSLNARQFQWSVHNETGQPTAAASPPVGQQKVDGQ